MISATTPSGSRNVIATPPATGIVSPSVRSARAGVVAERVDDHAHLAARVADRLAGVARLEHARASSLLGRRARRRAGAAAARGRPARPRARPGRRPSRARPRRRPPRRPRAGSRPAPPRWPARARSSVTARRCRASSTSAAISGDVSSASGCHCTPSAKRLRRDPRSPRAGRRPSPSRSPRGRRRSRRRPGGGATSSACTSSPRGARGQRAVGEPHVVVGVSNAPGDAPVVLVADVVGQVLDQRAAAGDVHHLHAAADAEERHVALQRARAPSASSNASRSGRVAVCRRRAVAASRVGAAGEQQPSSRSSTRRGPRRGGSGGSISAMPAGALHGVDVAAREQHRLARPSTLQRARSTRGAEPDDRRPHAQATRRLAGSSLDDAGALVELDVAHRAGERVPRAAPATRCRRSSSSAADRDRRVVDVASSRTRRCHGTPAGVNGRQKMTTMIADPDRSRPGSSTCTSCRASTGPGSNASPMRQRRKIGIT